MSDDINQPIELSDQELDEVSGGIFRFFGDENQIKQTNFLNFKQSKLVLDQVSIVNSEGSINALRIELTNTESTVMQDTTIT